MINRIYDELENLLEPNKVIVLYGPRRVGKTTILNKFTKTTNLKFRFDTGEDLGVQKVFLSQSLDTLKQYAAGYEVIIIDEAQLISNVGLGLKMMVDQIPGIKIIVSGSASLDLSNKIGEPLVGRKWTKILYPVSQFELIKESSQYDLEQTKEKYLIFGSYPEVLTSQTNQRKQLILQEVVSSYLLKDILSIESIKNPELLQKLLKLLAFQIGSEVSLSELATQLEINRNTVSRYIYLLEQSFIIYSLSGYSRNLRKEVTKKKKYYFWDNGIRNGIINNFNPLDTRDDLGQLWENFLVAERLKKQSYQPVFANNYFWRTWDQKEIDWVEMRGGKLFGFEFKFGKNKSKSKQMWLETYPGEAEFSYINTSNYLDFIT